MANTVNLPESIPESVVTKRQIINFYHTILENLALPLARETYLEEKGGMRYEYLIWAFKR
jgi:hypothetical protein